MATNWYVQQWVNRHQTACRLSPWKNDPEVQEQYRDATARCRSAFDELVGRELVVRTRRLDDK